MGDVLPLLRKRRAGEHRDNPESREHHLCIEQIHFVSPYVAHAVYLLGIWFRIRTVL
jgi:hypothetical protein